jgi:hypothetical protein
VIGVTNRIPSGNGLAAALPQVGAPLHDSRMGAFAVVAHRVTPTNTRLGSVLSPAQALTRLVPGDVALGRLDVLQTLDGIEPGLWALDRLPRSASPC